ncbi:hypothetical protein M5K25_023568 [Dendrobium thyrsiflorum]|uniref:Uncharacterized protein n=1 Tax=Dendrobium thyrsiflorum TaxID=117978 RepID=A0ABD0U940_DENTH
MENLIEKPLSRVYDEPVKCGGTNKQALIDFAKEYENSWCSEGSKASLIRPIIICMTSAWPPIIVGLTLGHRLSSNFLPTTVAQLWSFRPPSPADYGPSDFHLQTMVFPTSVAHRLPFFRLSSSNYGLSDLRRPPTMVLLTSFAR